MSRRKQNNTMTENQFLNLPISMSKLLGQEQTQNELVVPEIFNRGSDQLQQNSGQKRRDISFYRQMQETENIEMIKKPQKNQIRSAMNSISP